jgi:hypothetical protein
MTIEKKSAIDEGSHGEAMSQAHFASNMREARKLALPSVSNATESQEKKR